MKENNVVSNSDFALSKLMVSMREVADDDAFIESMVGFLVVSLTKKHQMHIKNFLVLEDGTFCMNLDENDSITTVKEKIKK